MLTDLQSRILKSFLLILALNWVLALLLLAAFFSANSQPPKLIGRNYQSIAALQSMRQAWTALRHPREPNGHPAAWWRTRFEEKLRFEEGNLTEPGEDVLAAELRKDWEKGKDDIAMNDV